MHTKLQAGETVGHVKGRLRTQLGVEEEEFSGWAVRVLQHGQVGHTGAVMRANLDHAGWCALSVACHTDTGGRA